MWDTKEQETKVDAWKAHWTNGNAVSKSQFSHKENQLQSADGNSAAALNLRWTQSAMLAMHSGSVGFFLISLPLASCHVDPRVKEKTQILLFSPHRAPFIFYLLTPLSSRLPGAVCGWKTIFSVHTARIPSGGIGLRTSLLIISSVMYEMWLHKMKRGEKEVANAFLHMLYQDLRGNFCFLNFGRQSKEKMIMFNCSSRRTHFAVC